SWPPHSYPPGQPGPPGGGGRRTGVIAAVIGLVVVIAGVVVAVVLLTSGDDDKGDKAGPSNSSTTGTKTRTGEPTDEPTDEPTPTSTRTTGTPTTRSATTAAAGGVLGNLKANDCIDTVAATAFVRDPIMPVPCSGTTSHWKVINVFPSSEVNVCESLPAQQGYVGHLKEFGSTGRIACLGFTRNTSLQDLKNLAGDQVATMTQAEFDQLKQSYRDKGVRIE
ncbi:MAG: hypothetical protein HOV68_25920, partial [Streptomycetaceae bacterium]|nr:hypothetical protein [Streptomycetaceae bacterium]